MSNDELDDLVERWHKCPYTLITLEAFIRTYTGWSHEEYGDWVVTARIP